MFKTVFIATLLLVYSNAYSQLVDKNKIEDIERALQNYPNDIELYKIKSRYFEKRNSIYEAIAPLLKANSLVSSDYEIRAKIGRLYDKALMNDSAVFWYQKVIEAKPESWQIIHNLGIVKARMGEYQEAIALQNRVLEINPEFAGAYYSLACYYSILKDKEKALTYLEEVFRRKRSYIDYASKDADLDFIRSTPEYEALVDYIKSNVRF